MLLLIISLVLAQRDHALVTINEAKTAAESQFFAAKAVGVDLKTKRGIQVYEVELNNGIIVRVDAHSGTVMKIRVKQEDN